MKKIRLWAQNPQIDRKGSQREHGDLTKARAIAARGNQLAALPASAEIKVWEAGEWPVHAEIIYLGEVAGEEYVLLCGVSDSENEADQPVVQPAATTSAQTQLATAGTEYPHQPKEFVWSGLRDLLTQARLVTGAEDDLAQQAVNEIIVTAVAMVQWWEKYQYCPSCAGELKARQAGWVRECENCAQQQYPRSDPAIIVAIVDDQDRLLIAHSALWSANRYSHLAGYVEPGESLEQAVHREVEEESSLKVTDLKFFGSQPWPFPASIMVAFVAVALTTEIEVDGEEITDARWVSREELLQLAVSGDVILPPAGSIARDMTDAWLQGEL